jgi:CDP-glucose 4,6-dehydratase
VETGQLRLSWEKAATRLDWQPVYAWDQALGEITAWFKAFQNGENMLDVCQAHIQTYVEQAKLRGVGWVG